MANSVVPKSIACASTLQLEQTIQNMISTFKMELCFLYMVDTCSEAALDYLADQFDVVTQYKIAATIADRRGVIKDAIRIKKSMGKVAGIKAAIAFAGVTGATIAENVPNGDAATDWANFKIAQAFSLGGVIGPQADYLRQLVLEYKAARDYFMGIFYTVGIAESIPSASETVAFTYNADETDTLFTGGFKYDGSKKYNGTQKYKPGVEDIQWSKV